MTVPCLLSSAQHERNGQALTVIGPVDTLVLIAAMSAPLAWIRVYQGLGMGGQKVVGWSQRVGLLLVLSLLTGLPENISHFRAWFSCHSYVRLLFFKERGGCIVWRVWTHVHVSGWPSWRLPAVKRALSRLIISKCDWSTWMWLVNLWRIILMCDKRIWLGGIWSLHTLWLCNPVVIRISIFSKHPSDSPWHWRYLPSTILFFQVLTGVEK